MSMFNRDRNTGLLNPNKKRGLFGGGTGRVKPTENLFQENDRFYLKILDLFKRFFINRGMDYEQLRLLVKVKMAVNERAMIKESGKQGNVGTGFTFTLVIQLVLGIFTSLILLLPGSIPLRYLLVFSLLFMYMSISLIAQLAQILLSPEDLLVLPVRPVSPAVLNMARIIQVAIYQATAHLTYALPVMILGFVLFGPAVGILAVIATTFLSLFILLLSLAIYLVAARYFSGEKLRDVISYLQIFMVVLMSVGYQFANEFFMSLSLGEGPTPGWLVLIPTYWFAAPMGLPAAGADPSLLAGTVLMVLSVALLGFGYFRYSGYLEQRLIRLAQDTAGDEKPKTAWRERLASLLCRDPLERTYFTFTWQMLKHERSFKSAVYPALAIYNLLPYGIVFSIFFSGPEAEELPADAFPWYVGLYMVLLILPLLLGQIQASDYHEAGWIFRLGPDNQDGAYARGLSKAVWARLLLPPMVLHLVIVGIFAGLRGISTVISLAALTYILMLVMAMTMRIRRPFTKERTVKEAQGCGTMIIITPVVFLLGGLQIGSHAMSPYLGWAWTALLTLTALGLIFFFKGERRFKVPAE